MSCWQLINMHEIVYVIYISNPLWVTHDRQYRVWAPDTCSDEITEP